ncbi:MAG: hypothetical protein JWQ49_3574 [Edaphobacter sp.]|nr:hypothetical protein [Edaphobacter sp.]
MHKMLKSGSAGLLALYLSSVMVIAQQPFQVLSDASGPTIAGRSVQLDVSGKLLPWPTGEDTGYSYSSHFLTQWTILQDQLHRTKLPYFYCCYDFDRRTFETNPDHHWANSTGYLRAMMQGFVERLYPYTGDSSTVQSLEEFVDYELENGLTPKEYAWSQVPYPSADPGSRRYTGWSHHGEDYVEPHVVGEDGYGYVRLYEMTGDTKYLQAGIRCADSLLKNYKVGNESVSPWPYRAYARDGRSGVGNMGAYSANVVEPIMLFDELIRISQGDTEQYARVREGAWQWLKRYPMKNNVWSGYFEDVDPNTNNLNQVIPLELARYLLLHPEKDASWNEDSKRLIEWVKTTPKWPKYIVHGALVTTEQGDGKEFCCNPPGQCCDSHTARLAAAEAFYAWRTGDISYKESAYRSFNWVTYFQGFPAAAHAPFSDQWWFTDEYADGPRRLMDAFWAFPEWAPVDESHLLGSSSVVTKIRYGNGSVTYSTFDELSNDVLRLDFVPESVMAGGRLLHKVSHPDEEGYSFDEKTSALRIHHEHARDMDIQGQRSGKPPKYVRFDNPHLAAGWTLQGQYPAGLVDWGNDAWMIHAPEGKFGTFCLSLKDSKTTHASFGFPVATVFAGIDAYNGGARSATIRLRSPQTREKKYTLAPGQLLRIRTGWSDPSSAIEWEFENAEGLLLDNFAYSD